MTSYLFSEPGCTGDQSKIVNMEYADDYAYILESFASFNLSRGLKAGEQLDLSMEGQDAGQDDSWACGHFVIKYVGQTGEGCYDGINASCIRLWHY